MFALFSKQNLISQHLPVPITPVGFRTKFIEDSKWIQLVKFYSSEEGRLHPRGIVLLEDPQLPESEKRLIARAVESHLLGRSELLSILPIELCEEASSWVQRILQLIGRSKSAHTVYEQSVDGVVVDRVQSENVMLLGPQLEALEGWKHLDLSALLEQLGLCASQVATAQVGDQSPDQPLKRLLRAGRLQERQRSWGLSLEARRIG